MSTPPDPSGTREPWPIPGQDPAAGPDKHSRPWAWIVACVVLVVVAGGFAIWAVGLQSDLDDQQTKTTQAQQDADQAKQEAADANDAAGAMQDELDQISQGLDDVGDQLEQAGDDAEQSAEEAVDGIKGQVATLKDQVAGAGDEASATPAPVTAEGTRRQC